MQEEKIRINKYISQCGYCSRREADRMIAKQMVCINGTVAIPGAKVSPSDHITIDGKPLSQDTSEIIIAFNKPKGVVCTTSKKDPDNVIDYIDFPERIYPVGRLDKLSTGLLLLTNNGQLMDDVLRGSNHHEKEYIVSLDRPMTESIYKAMEQGVPILDTITRPCRIACKKGNTFHITLTQGLNRQIRRMCEYFGYRVLSLKRIRIMNISLGDLPEGRWRYLTEQEICDLKAACVKE